MSATIRSKLSIIKKRARKSVSVAFSGFVQFMRKAISLAGYTALHDSTPPSTPILTSRQLKTLSHRRHRSPLQIFNSTRKINTSPRRFRRLFAPISPSKLSSPELVPQLRLTPEGEESPSEQHNFVRLENTGNDCFLNAALQYMRRTRDLGTLLANRRVPFVQNDEQEKKETTLKMLGELLWRGGRVNPRPFREALPIVIRDLEPTFLTSQQDAYEILTKMFDDLIPDDISKQFYIESSRWRRCRDVLNCRGFEHIDAGAIHYQHIGRNNQVIDLESLLLDQWTPVIGENELRHCSSCCECCQAATEGHKEDDCDVCKGDKRPYNEEQRFRFQCTSNYALIAFNILHETERVDWALSGNCDMDGMRLMGHQWKAVSVIKHIGLARTPLSHYVTYTREDDGQWWLHDDDRQPVSIGERYRIRCSHRYPHGATDMHGVLAMLFEKLA